MYDRIINLHKLYLNHVNYVEKKKEDLSSRKKEVAKMLMESKDPNDMEKLAFELFIDNNIHANDINLIFNKLYTLVEAYVELEGAIKLPSEVTELCNNYASIVMKTIYVVNDSLICEERVKGSIDKIKETISKTGEMSNMVSQLKKLIEG